jgi:hypothetical protein
VIEVVAVRVTFHRYRVLFDDGVVMDFIASRDDSVLREEMRVSHWGAKGAESVKAKDGKERRIVGVTALGEVCAYTPPTDFDDVPAEMADDGMTVKRSGDE